MTFHREHLPAPASYYASEGLRLIGRGKWRTTSCVFHGGSDSMRINAESGAFRCMACGARGGDLLGYHMAAHGLGFVDAARALGAWVEDGKPRQFMRPSRLSARDALECIGLELCVCVIVISDARKGRLPTDNDWHRFLQAAGRVEHIAREATA